MPNWCNNTLIVQGAKTNIARFLRKGIKKGIWALSHYLPMPEELEGTESPQEKNPALKKKYGYDNWYDWRCANYGCKWDCGAEEKYIDKEPTKVTLRFESPWSPPLQFVENVQKMYPRLDFDLFYVEEGMFFAGHLYTARDANGGIWLKDECGEPIYRNSNGEIVVPHVNGNWDDAYVCNPYEEEWEKTQPKN